ncbi:MAG: imidazoleglycerol-phosphate dehydratase [Dehalococcoidia bacterium]|jgi:imidazoleglycerol-phosphate dehydratase|nr:imidazoleglycerol-phosphate dehydratase [Chloroflexota bacterium]RZP14094.1 MAG: imidazoleglycerol-phosphate dehydratase [Chloroflexota bacterium]|tara:strand:- start:125 stop:718 length:594 start_codon:yes stop_codon:yes gene_type:complete
MAKERKSKNNRSTGETTISIEINLDGKGISNINSPIGMLNHMLDQIARHGLIDINATITGDLETGTHHIIEDTAIVLGICIDEALGDRSGILRMGDKTCLLDEALCSVALDLSGRGYAVIDMGSSDNEGEFSLDMGRHFYESLSSNGRFGIHLKMISGTNHHHILESSFKTFSRALREAASIDPRRIDSIASTKGLL